MKKIQNLRIDTSKMPAEAVTRNFVVGGEIGGEFILYEFQNDTLKYYDFVDQAFELGHNDKNNNLKVKLSGSTYNGSIKFPSGGGTYTIKLAASPGTEIKGSNKYIISKSIDKIAANAIVTFQAATTNTSNYATFPTTTSTGGPSESKDFDFDWDIVNASTDAGGFGLRLTDTSIHITNDFWYFSTTDTVNIASPKTDTVNGAVSSSTDVTLDTDHTTTGIKDGDFVYGTGVTNGTTVASRSSDDLKDIVLSAAMTISDGVTLSFVTPSTEVIVDSVTDISTGMIIGKVSSGSLSGEPYILSIDTLNKTLTMSSEQAFADGITLTFKAVGSEAIKNAIGLDVEFTPSEEIEGTILTTTVRADSDGDYTTSTTVTLTDTHGIAGGNIISYTGVDVDNSSSNAITSVTPDPGGGDGDGLMVVQLTQLLRAKTVLTFNDIFKTINFRGTININQFPSANRTIYLDIDKLITVGAAS